MATARVRHDLDTSTTPESPRVERRTESLEDRLDYSMVRNARAIARERNEKSVAWEDVKKKLLK